MKNAKWKKEVSLSVFQYISGWNGVTDVSINGVVIVAINRDVSTFFNSNTYRNDISRVSVLWEKMGLVQSERA